jgi:serine/threonine protein kinase
MGKTLHQESLGTIGRYRLLAKLGEGATGTVFKAEDPESGAVVAIKLVSAAKSRDPVMLKRFEREFTVLNTLNHPNIVRGLEFGWQESRPYIVMEYVAGQDMWVQIARAGRIPEAEAVGLITQVAMGLHEAHKHGIIHRDLKPDNIMISPEGLAKLTDLGLSKDLENDVELTRPDKGLGTPNFMAPEQFSDAKHAGVRCDVYSLGATLYMALTGQLPFAGKTLSVMLKMKLADDLLPPRKIVPGLSSAVDLAVRRALLADPDRRFGSCPEFVAALTRNPGEMSTNELQRGSPLRKRPSGHGSNRRGAVRFDCALTTKCTINVSVHPEESEHVGTWDARVCDLSIGGIGLLLTRRFEPGSVLTVDLSAGDSATKLTRQLRIVRVEPVAGHGWFLGAILMEKLSKEELRQLL